MSLLDTERKLSANLLESFGWKPFKYPNKNPLFPETMPWIPSTIYIKSYYDDSRDWPGGMKYDVFLGVFHKVVCKENDTDIIIDRFEKRWVLVIPSLYLIHETEDIDDVNLYLYNLSLKEEIH